MKIYDEASNLSKEQWNALNRIEKIERVGLDLKLFKKKSNAKTATGLILSKAKVFKDNNNFEMAKFMEELYKEIKDLEKQEKIKIDMWKGKSGIKLIEEPNRFICITYKKDEKEEEPKEIKKEIMKEELNNLIVVINLFENKNKIPTSKIAEKLYNKDWKLVFSDRDKHIELTYMLNILEQKGLIKYSRKGFTTVIKKLDYFMIK